MDVWNEPIPVFALGKDARGATPGIALFLALDSVTPETTLFHSPSTATCSLAGRVLLRIDRTIFAASQIIVELCRVIALPKNSRGSQNNPHQAGIAVAVAAATQPVPLRAQVAWTHPQGFSAVHPLKWGEYRAGFVFSDVPAEWCSNGDAAGQRYAYALRARLERKPLQHMKDVVSALVPLLSADDHERPLSPLSPTVVDAGYSSPPLRPRPTPPPQQDDDPELPPYLPAYSALPPKKKAPKKKKVPGTEEVLSDVSQHEDPSKNVCRKLNQALILT
ncbi:hypothetical protein HDU87_000509 [Geranomyces variabilis]|uniref:Uncharacterized protein n=1 Tax=Geranomyces variabilis TaxID=109894 RepID=A0AAD5XNW5_9FUNG|nr:hypothetical protein HDU87_000509 [Geranomyces variabilis]